MGNLKGDNLPAARSAPRASGVTVCLTARFVWQWHTTVADARVSPPCLARQIDSPPRVEDECLRNRIVIGSDRVAAVVFFRAGRQGRRTQCDPRQGTVNGFCLRSVPRCCRLRTRRCVRRTSARRRARSKHSMSSAFFARSPSCRTRSVRCSAALLSSEREA